MKFLYISDAEAYSNPAKRLRWSILLKYLAAQRGKLLLQNILT